MNWPSTQAHRVIRSSNQALEGGQKINLSWKHGHIKIKPFMYSLGLPTQATQVPPYSQIQGLIFLNRHPSVVLNCCKVITVVPLLPKATLTAFIRVPLTSQVAFLLLQLSTHFFPYSAHLFSPCLTTIATF